MSFSDKLKNNKTSYVVNKNYRDAIQTLKNKYPYIKLNTSSRKYSGISDEFIDDLNREYALCGVEGYLGVDKYYLAYTNLENSASIYSAIFNEAEKDDDPFEEIRNSQYDNDEKQFKVNQEFLNRFDPMVTIFYIKLSNRK